VAGFELEDVAALGLAGSDRAGWQLDDRVRAESARDAAGSDIASDLDHPAIPVEIDQIEGELHGKGVDGFAGDDPQAFAGLKAGAAEKTSITAGSGIGDLDARADFSLTSDVANAQEPGRAGFLRGKEAPPEGGFGLWLSHSIYPSVVAGELAQWKPGRSRCRPLSRPRNRRPQRHPESSACSSCSE